METHWSQSKPHPLYYSIFPVKDTFWEHAKANASGTRIMTSTQVLSPLPTIAISNLWILTLKPIHKLASGISSYDSAFHYGSLAPKTSSGPLSFLRALSSQRWQTQGQSDGFSCHLRFGTWKKWGFDGGPFLGPFPTCREEIAFWTIGLWPPPKYSDFED